MSVSEKIGAAALAILMAATTSSAQDAEDGGSNAAKSAPLTFDANVEVTEKYTTNVFSTPTGEQDDFVTLLAPEASLTLDVGSFELSLTAAAEIGRFADLGSEDYEDVVLSGDGSVALGSGFFLFGGGGYAWEHEDRNSPDDAGGARPIEFEDATAFLGLGVERSRFSGRLGVNARNLNFDDVPAAGGALINQDDRDRLVTEIGGRIGYDLTAEQQLFVQGIYDRRDYDDAVDDAGFNRDSEGAQLAVGLSGEAGPLSGEVLIGVITQDYEDPTFDTVTVLDLGADLSYRIDPNTRVTATLSRTLNETTLNGASGSVDTVLGARVSRSFAPDLSGSAYAFISDSAYRNADRKDTILEVGFSLRKYLNERLYLGAAYGYTARDSNVAGADYDDHSVFLRVGADLNPRYEPGAPLAATGEGEAYVGVQAGLDSLVSRVDGPRGGGGRLSAEFGDSGPSGGVFVGYRRALGGLVLGLEAEAEISDADWQHDGGRIFGVEKKNSLGLSGIAGIRLRNDALFYGRVGVYGADIGRNYARGGAATERSGREIDVRAGVGVEFPVSGRLSGRMEYLIGDIADFDIGAPFGLADDNFSTFDTTARIGLVYRFGGSQEAEVVPFNFDGPYAGARIGHEMLQSKNVGPRPDAAAPAFTLDATRASDGATGGVFAGYGRRFGPVYLGAEVEAGYSRTSWDIDRDPSGRIYSLEKGLSVGAGVRVGYVLNETALIYGTVGVVGAQLDTDYSFRGVDTSDSDFTAGLRFGGGVELGLGERTSLRLDFTRTEYGASRIDYGAGTDRIDSAENVFSIGLAYRF